MQQQAQFQRVCFSVLATVLICVLALSATADNPDQSHNHPPATTAAKLDQYLALHPFVAAGRDHSGAARKLFGRDLARGHSPRSSADAFCRTTIAAFGIDGNDLIETAAPNRQNNAQPVMYDPQTGRYRFTAFSYAQQRDGLDVYGSRLVVLVRNEPGYPVVLANGQVRDLGDFRADAPRQVMLTNAALQQSALAHVEQLATLDAHHHDQPGAQPAAVLESETVIFAGINGVHLPPRLARRMIVQRGIEKWQLVIDASTGAVLDEQSLICQASLIVAANAFATDGIGADFCEAESLFQLKYLAIEVEGETYFTSVFGNVVIPGLSLVPTTATAGLSGQWFDVTNAAGPNAVASDTVIPPGPAILQFNATNTSEHVRAQVNAYVHANIARDFILEYNPVYPTLNGEHFPITVNRDDGFCPGNAWYDILEASLNFCETGITGQGAPRPNTAFSSIIYHEFGHHIVQASGSGQGQYGEGFGDALSVVMLDTPLVGLGFFNDCGQPLRTAEAGVSVPCSDSIHFCGQALSGCIWDTRNQLVQTEPDEYRNILASLLINSVLIHTGAMIEPDLVVDFLTLDDDNGNIFDGTPHFDEIAAGFAPHGMIIPTLDPIAFDFPNGLPEFTSPAGSTAIDVEIRSLSGQLEPGSAFATFIVDGDQITAPLVPATGRADMFTVQAPAATCGRRVQYFFTAESTDGAVVTSPFDAPQSTYESIAAVSAKTVHSDDFEDAAGWTAQPLDAIAGWWDRGVPISDFQWIYNPAVDSDGSGQCWLTGNHPGNSDVDDGSVRLNSPVLPYPVDQALISYDYYLYLDNDNGADRMVIEMRDAVGPWVEVARHDTSGGFQWHTHRITPFELLDAGLQPDYNLQMRFTVSDLTPQSIVEAAVDNVRIRLLTCVPETIPGDINGDGKVNIFDLLCLIDAYGACPPPCPPNCPSDVNEDCTVDLFDLLFVIDAWTG